MNKLKRILPLLLCFSCSSISEKIIPERSIAESGGEKSISSYCNSLLKTSYSVIGDVLGAAKENLIGRMSKISKTNLSKVKSTFSPLSPIEEITYKNILKFEFGFYHRLNPERLKWTLDKGYLANLEDSALDASSFKSNTPTSEINLYKAQKYVFGWVGFWPSTNKYGDIIIHIKKEYWKNNSWISQKSGYEYFMDAEQSILDRKLLENELTYNRYDHVSNELVIKAREYVENDIFLPEEYQELSALKIVSLLRGRGIDFDQLNKLKNMDLKEKIIKIIEEEYVKNRKKVGFFEGKLEGSVPLDQISHIEIPQKYIELIEKLEKLSIPVSIIRD